MIEDIEKITEYRIANGGTFNKRAERSPNLALTDDAENVFLRQVRENWNVLNWVD